MHKKPNKTLVIAHRGSRLRAPENTLAAFELAIHEKANGIELDVHLSKDKELIVSHDDELIRWTGIPYLISRMNLSQIKKMEVGSYFSTQYRGEKIPSLREVFELAKHKLLINVELKGTNIRDDGRERILKKLIDEYKLNDQVLVSSFNPFALLRMKKAAPEIKRGYLFYEKQDPLSKRAFFSPMIQPYSYHPSLEVLKLHSVSKLHQKNIQCWVWTINDATTALELAKQEVDAIITDDPKLIYQTLKEGLN